MTTNVMTPLPLEDKNVKYHLVEAEEIEPTSTQAKKNPRMKKGKVNWSQFPLNLPKTNPAGSASTPANSNNGPSTNNPRNPSGMKKTNHDGKSHNNSNNNSNNNNSNTATNHNNTGGKKHHQNNNSSNIASNQDGQNNNNNNSNYHSKKNHHRNRGGRGGGKWKDRSHGKRYHDQQQQPQQQGGYYQGVFVPQMDPKLTAEYAKQQVEYYFTPENLVRDTFLRQQMDLEGYVPVAFLASFQSVYAIHQGYPSLLESLKNSEVVEMDIPNEKIRTRFSWQQWLWPNPNGGYGLPKYIKMSGNSPTNNSNSPYKNTTPTSSSTSTSSSSSSSTGKGIEPSPEDDGEQPENNEVSEKDL